MDVQPRRVLLEPVLDGHVFSNLTFPDSPVIILNSRISCRICVGTCRWRRIDNFFQGALKLKNDNEMRVCLRNILALVALIAVSPVLAQSKLIRLMVPFPPGASTDLIARDVAAKFSDSSGQAIIIENKTGATGAIAMDFVAKSSPDGYILGLISVSQGVNEALNGAQTPYDLVHDFTPVIQLSTFPFLLVINPKVPVRSVGELVSLAKLKPNTLRYGSSGTGGITHLSGSWLASASKTAMVHVPYKGAGPAMTDVVGGHIDFIFASISLGSPFLARNQVRALAITSENRNTQFPDLPTVRESGIPDFVVDGWNGIVGPAGMQAPVVSRLNNWFALAVNNPDMRSKMALDGQLPAAGTSAQFGAYLASEMRKWSRIVKEGGLKVE